MKTKTPQGGTEKTERKEGRDHFSLATLVTKTTRDDDSTSHFSGGGGGWQFVPITDSARKERIVCVGCSALESLVCSALPLLDS